MKESHMRSLAVLILFVFSGVGVAEDKKPADVKKPVGTWTKKAGDFEFKFTFKKDNVVVFSMSNGTDGCDMTSKCTFEKDGTVKCEVTQFEKKGNFPEEKKVGYKFSFKFAAKEKTATVSDIEGEDIDKSAKDAVEGDYDKSAD
jgi:uncharacterized protein YkuJ